MNEALLKRLRVVTVLLSRKTNESFLKQVDLERLEAGNEHVDAQIILEAINKVRVGDILTDDIAIFSRDRLFGTNDLDALAATRSSRLHNVH